MRTAAILLLGLCLAAPACSKPLDEPGASTFKPTGGEPLPPGPKELQIEDTQVGTGDRAVKAGDKIKVHYTGTLMNGRKFDSSRDRNEPFEFTVGEGVIAGWSQGVVGMKKGGKRKLTIPAALGYGAKGQQPTIPGDAGLKFDIELLDFSQ
jgi:FKBP-type peptidyl-prolyl cis-trans isomerase FkpA